MEAEVDLSADMWPKSRRFPFKGVYSALLNQVHVNFDRGSESDWTVSVNGSHSLISLTFISIHLAVG